MMLDESWNGYPHQTRIMNSTFSTAGVAGSTVVTVQQQSTIAQILVHSVNYLVKSQLMSVRIISNFRTMNTFLLSDYQLNEKYQYYLKQTLNDIQSDMGTFISYLGKLTTHFLQNRDLQVIYPQVYALKYELGAIAQDAAGRYLAFSPLIYRFLTGHDEADRVQNSIYQILCGLVNGVHGTHNLETYVMYLQENIEVLTTENQKLENELQILRNAFYKPNSQEPDHSAYYSLQARSMHQTEVSLLKYNISDLRNQVREYLQTIDSQNNIIQLLKDYIANYKEYNAGPAQTKVTDGDCYQLQDLYLRVQYLAYMTSKGKDLDGQDIGQYLTMIKKHILRYTEQIDQLYIYLYQKYGRIAALEEQVRGCEELTRNNSRLELECGKQQVQLGYYKNYVELLTQYLSGQKYINDSLKHYVQVSNKPDEQMQAVLDRTRQRSIADLDQYIVDLQSKEMELSRLKDVQEYILKQQQEIEEGVRALTNTDI